MTPAVPVYFEIIDFIASGTTPEKVVQFHPSSEAQQRVEYLLNRQNEGILTAEEEGELDHFVELEHIIMMAKAQARQILSGQ